jgi:lipopolysaccharide transport system ATP-binding protein
LELFDGDERPLRGDVPAGGPLKAVIHLNLDMPCTSFDASIAFDTLGGQRVCTAHSAYEPDREHEERTGEQVFTCEIPSLPLIPGEYKVHVGLDIASGEADWIEDATRLTVLKSDFYGTGILPTKGLLLLQNRWSLEYQREEVAI